MFTKILIANRGEIACRVIDTARRMGVATVAVYSDADAGARHVALADEAVHIGPAPARDSYLVADRIIAAAKATGAQAVHPGYGFLSENPDFVDALTEAGLVFIGPSADAIRAMGLKDAAKRLMEEAGVPVVPGYHGDNQDPGFLAAQAADMGYPVLIKASAGGGGKGMRRVDAPDDFTAALASAQREAKAAFGDDKVLVEKYVTQPRHIEIQIFGDGTRAIHLFERDCSLQRRHQKVIEEAPAPGMTDAVRTAMGAAAVRAAEAIGYAGAGTVEFIVDGSDGLKPDGFWFMEMNTRLQVEHPVTEEITGVDLVEWQLRVASGEALPAAQEDLTITGHAFEARLYAEDAARRFMPQTGPLDHLVFPASGARIDTGVRQGDRITPFYDPMIAKVTVHGRDRDQALARLRAALAATEVAGTTTNVAFLAALASHSGFANGDVDTGLIDRDLADLTAPPAVDPVCAPLAALHLLGLLGAGDGGVWDQRNGWRLWGAPSQSIVLEGAEGPIDIQVTTLGPGRFQISGIEISAVLDGDVIRYDANGTQGSARVVTHGVSVTVFHKGIARSMGVPDPLASAVDAAGGGDNVTAPMTGLVKAVNVSAGTRVSRGDPLAIMEAMKMEHTLSAPRDGTIAKVTVSAGDQIDEGAIMIALEVQDG